MIASVLRYRRINMARSLQLPLPARRTWGGRRRGAGRKRTPSRRPSVPHVTRPPHVAAHPVHVTLRVCRPLPSCWRRFPRCQRRTEWRVTRRLPRYSLQCTRRSRPPDSRGRRHPGASSRPARSHHPHGARSECRARTPRSRLRRPLSCPCTDDSSGRSLCLDLRIEKPSEALRKRTRTGSLLVGAVV